ncbi:vWA domain-containing protein [Asaia prunellae]|uniref:vWA domain-containing protein n=1 Tax=Asaia prunellae TaxID=610245 RepID=UPI000472C575|nr:RNA-binding protein [Asaia prunellae]
MANRSLFASSRGRLVPQSDCLNQSGAPAYDLAAPHKLAQLAMTGSFGGGYYKDAASQMQELIALAGEVSPGFLARAAIHVRERGHMKDTPCVLLAVLSLRDPALFARAFPRIVTNGKMLRNFVQVMRSGQVGRKSLGSRPKALVQDWLNAATEAQLLSASIGQSPSLADVIRMVHPCPRDKRREAFYAWLIDRPAEVVLLPEPVQTLIAFRSGQSDVLPEVPFQLLGSLPLTPAHWESVARRASWQMLRQSLNMLTRFGAFSDAGTVAHVAAVLRDPERIRAARAMPYQLMATLRALSPDVDGALADALHDAMELAVANVPHVAGRVVICPDVSGSMASPVTGFRRGATSTVRCIDVAALVAAAIKRANRDALVLPFEQHVCDVVLEPRDTIMTNATRLAAIGGGGTDCAAPIVRLNERKEQADLVIFISDNESWMSVDGNARGTALMREWECLKQRCPAARLVCVDIQPYGSSQASERDDILNIGGFSDAVFDQIAAFASGEAGASYWVREIEKERI